MTEPAPQPSPPTPLACRLKEHIDTHGPLSIVDFHTQAMTSPAHGYYTTTPVLGTAGDFVTAPDICPLFSEIVGIWALQAWEALGAPDTFSIVELGGGQGTLMHGLLKTIFHLKPQLQSNVTIGILEINPHLRRQQEVKLSSLPLKALQWFETVEQTLSSSDQTLFIANEFFDALPHNQWEKGYQGWHPRLITNITDQPGHFTYTLGASISQEDQSKLGSILPKEAAPTSIIEYSPLGHTYVRQIMAHLATHKGAFWICDYGYEAVPPTRNGLYRGASWQGICQNTPVDPLTHVGQADLSFHVNFGAISRIAKDAGCQAILQTQRDFLLTHGLEARAKQLRSHMDAPTWARLQAGITRLTHPSQMGTLFKVLWGSFP